MTGCARSTGEQTVRKVSRRLLPFLFILYVIAYLDRVNFGYAALEMNSALSIPAEMFGFLPGIFFIGYLLFEVPGNMILRKVGARIWIARIMNLKQTEGTIPSRQITGRLPERFFYDFGIF
jgi:MFS transporter, ACS family, tartrate transporter